MLRILSASSPRRSSAPGWAGARGERRQTCPPAALALVWALEAGCGAAAPGPPRGADSGSGGVPPPDPVAVEFPPGGAESPTTDAPAAPPTSQEVAAPTIDPTSASDLDPARWVEPTRLDSTIRLDIRYATADNFMGEAIYPCARCLLRPEVAAAIVAVHRELQGAGLGGLVLFDCYRPSSLQRRLWEKSPDPRAVAPPSRGSMHARGLAVDLSIIDREGHEVDMGTPYDHFGPRAYHGARGLAPAAVERRERLRSAMERAGFRPLRSEWWHYSWSGSRAPADDLAWACPPAPG